MDEISRKSCRRPAVRRALRKRMIPLEGNALLPSAGQRGGASVRGTSVEFCANFPTARGRSCGINTGRLTALRSCHLSITAAVCPAGTSCQNRPPQTSIRGVFPSLWDGSARDPRSAWNMFTYSAALSRHGESSSCTNMECFSRACQGIGLQPCLGKRQRRRANG